LKFQLLTAVFALIFIVLGLVWLWVYRNFSQLWKAANAEKIIQKSLKNLMLIFGALALFMTLASMSLGYALLQRMMSGIALLG